MQRGFVLLLVVVLAFTFALPAAAGGNGPGGGSGGAGSGTGQGQQGTRGTFALTGTIAAIGEQTLTIDVLSGNKLAQPYRGTRLTVTLTARTRYVYKDGTTSTIIAFDDLQDGQPVSVNGTLANGVWTVSRVTVGASLSCLP